MFYWTNGAILQPPFSWKCIIERGGGFGGVCGEGKAIFKAQIFQRCKVKSLARRYLHLCSQAHLPGSVRQGKYSHEDTLYSIQYV